MRQSDCSNTTKKIQGVTIIDSFTVYCRCHMESIAAGCFCSVTAHMRDVPG
jgi:hypothetical protein